MNTKILVVDAQPDVRKLIPLVFQDEIQQGKYKFDFAFSDEDVFEKLKDDGDINLILLDIGGLDIIAPAFLELIKGMKGVSVATVIISYFGDTGGMKRIRTAMNSGAFDFLVRPINHDDLKITVAKALEHIGLIKKMTKRLHDKNRRNQREFKIAEKVQSCMINCDLPDIKDTKDISIHGQALQAHKVGGDFFDYFFIDNNRFGIVVADVSGHGVSAALFMAISKSAVRSTALKGMAAHSSMEIANNILCESSLRSIFVTAIYGILDRRDGSFEYCNCGHLRPFRITINGEVTPLENEKQKALAIDKNVVYKSSVIKLERGETLFLYTDGLSDTSGENEERFGEERVRNSLRNSNDLSIEKVTEKAINEALAFGKGEQEDDITCLALRYLGA